jgi:hypothetical protein
MNKVMLLLLTMTLSCKAMEDNDTEKRRILRSVLSIVKALCEDHDVTPLTDDQMLAELREKRRQKEELKRMKDNHHPPIWGFGSD